MKVCMCACLYSMHLCIYVQYVCMYLANHTIVILCQEEDVEESDPSVPPFGFIMPAPDESKLPLPPTSPPTPAPPISPAAPTSNKKGGYIHTFKHVYIHIFMNIHTYIIWYRIGVQVWVEVFLADYFKSPGQGDLTRSPRRSEARTWKQKNTDASLPHASRDSHLVTQHHVYVQIDNTYSYIT